MRHLKRLATAALVLCALAVGAALLAPVLGRRYLIKKIIPLVARRLSCTIKVRHVDVSLDTVTLEGLVLRSAHDAAAPPLMRIPRVTVWYRLPPLLGGVAEATLVEVHAPSVRLFWGPDGRSNFHELLTRTLPRGKTSSAERSRLRLHQVHIRGGRLALEDRRRRVSVTVLSLEGELRQKGRSELRLSGIRASVPLFRANLELARVVTILEAGTGAGPGVRWTRISLFGGRARLLPRLELSGIRGQLLPAGSEGRVSVRLEGSYGGAETRLWSARGWLDHRRREGRLSLRAARFSLGRIASLLARTPVILPQRTLIDSKLELSLSQSVLSFNGHLRINDLSLFHPSLARTPVLELSGTVQTSGKLDFEQGRLTLEELLLSARGIQARASGTLDRLEGQPVVDLRLEVPPLPCQQVLEAFPPSLVPQLQGFSLKGTFFVDLHTHIDFVRLDGLKLGGKVGIRGCRVESAPQWASAERLLQPFEHQVEILPDQRQVFVVGPDNPDFTPLAGISRHMISAVLTTEDGGFFKHRGFITSQFRAALARNLQRGGFRLGASTISMQMVKNVLLGPEKTLSRKLQELFLTWYLEQNLTKERIMEIYLNVIELGPGIYGVGSASRHYFGIAPAEITPLQAAFFATLLPSPKRRYAHYCQGKLSESWERYVRRVLKRMWTKGLLDEAAHSAASSEVITFARDTEALPAEECTKALEELLETWDEERLRRLREAVLGAAPHQLELYLKDGKGAGGHKGS